MVGQGELEGRAWTGIAGGPQSSAGVPDEPEARLAVFDFIDPAELIGHWGYPAIVGFVVAGTAGLPVPEESVLVAAGYLAWRGALRPTGHPHAVRRSRARPAGAAAAEPLDGGVLRGRDLRKNPLAGRGTSPPVFASNWNRSDMWRPTSRWLAVAAPGAPAGHRGRRAAGRRRQRADRHRPPPTIRP